MIENYTVPLEIAPEIEEQAMIWTKDFQGPLRDFGRAILDAKPPDPDLLKQAFAIVCPSSTVDQWPGPLTAIGAMSVWIAEHHNGRPHGYSLQSDGKWYPWLDGRGPAPDGFDTEQEARAWLVVEMHREETDV